MGELGGYEPRDRSPNAEQQFEFSHGLTEWMGLFSPAWRDPNLNALLQGGAQLCRSLLVKSVTGIVKTMMALKRTVFKATLFLVAILLLAYIAVLSIVNSAKFQDWVRAGLEDRTGYELAAGQLTLDPLFRLTLSDLTVSKASKPVLRADRIFVVLSPASWFSKSIYRVQLVKPTLHLDLSELFDSTEKTTLDINIRYLNIEDGTLVLKVGDGNAIDFRSLAMNAENVNLGQATGLNLRTDVPSLGGVLEIVATGNERENKATIRIEQTRVQGFPDVIQENNQSAPALEANVKLTTNAGEPIRLVADGKLNGMAIAAERFSGDFDVKADLTPDLKEAVIGAKLVMTELPSRPHFLPLTLPEGDATLTLEGNVELAQKKLAIKSLRLLSPLGDAAGTGFIHFGPAITLADTRVNLRKVSFEHLKPLLPSAVQALASGGQVEADLEIEGPWRSPSVRGITRSSGVRPQPHNSGGVVGRFLSRRRYSATGQKARGQPQGSNGDFGWRDSFRRNDGEQSRRAGESRRRHPYRPSPFRIGRRLKDRREPGPSGPFWNDGRP
jgi:hypothetical protein